MAMKFIMTYEVYIDYEVYNFQKISGTVHMYCATDFPNITFTKWDSTKFSLLGRFSATRHYREDLVPRDTIGKI